MGGTSAVQSEERSLASDKVKRDRFLRLEEVEANLVVHLVGKRRGKEATNRDRARAAEEIQCIQ